MSSLALRRMLFHWEPSQLQWMCPPRISAQALASRFKTEGDFTFCIGSQGDLRIDNLLVFEIVEANLFK